MGPRQVPSLRLPHTDESNTWSVVGSICIHGLIVLLIVWWQMRPVDESTTRRPGLAGDPGGGGVHFIRLDAPAASARQQATQPQPTPPPEPLVVPPTFALTLPVRKLDVPLSQSIVVGADAAGAGGSRGAGGGVGGGVGRGLGRDSGVGAGGEGGDIFPPRPKYTILPPLPQPGSVRGKTFRVHFWVNAEGRVTRVRVDPEIKDAGYRQQFLDLMREYGFEPARKLDGTRVDGEIDYLITL